MSQSGKLRDVYKRQILAWLVSRGMNKVSLREAAGRQEQSERLTDAVLSFVEGIGVIKSYNLLGEKSEELTGNFKRSRNRCV